MVTKTPPSQTAGQRFIGQVEWFSERKGYGFIGWEEDKDIFVHRSAILSRGKILQEGSGAGHRSSRAQPASVIEETSASC
jgi:cold shock CspA family protein